MNTRRTEDKACIFCEIVAGRASAAIVLDDQHTLAFADLRQANPGHFLVIPKAHIPDVRDLDAEVGAALMQSVTRVTRAVSTAFPNDGISLWHSIGPAAFQEVPHLHIHVHPRLPTNGACYFGGRSRRWSRSCSTRRRSRANCGTLRRSLEYPQRVSAPRCIASLRAPSAP